MWLRAAPVAPASAAPPEKAQRDRLPREQLETPGVQGVWGCWHLPTLTLGAPPCQGKPKPQATWTHNGHALDSQRVSVRTGDQDSILFIRSAQRSDSGRYELTVHVEGLEAKAAIDILVIGMEPGEQCCLKGDLEPPTSYPRADG